MKRQQPPVRRPNEPKRTATTSRCYSLMLFPQFFQCRIQTGTWIPLSSPVLRSFGFISQIIPQLWGAEISQSQYKRCSLTHSVLFARLPKVTRCHRGAILHIWLPLWLVFWTVIALPRISPAALNTYFIFKPLKKGLNDCLTLILENCHH